MNFLIRCKYSNPNGFNLVNTNILDFSVIKVQNMDYILLYIFVYSKNSLFAKKYAASIE